MNSHIIGLTVLLLVAVAGTASAQRRGIRTCSCQIGNGHSQQGKLVGHVCYVVGVGSCRSFAYEGSSQQQQQPQQHQQHQQQQPQQHQQFASQRRFGQNRFPFRSGFQSRFDTNRPSRFNTNRQSQFATRQSQFATSQPTTQFATNQPTPQFAAGRPTPPYPISPTPYPTRRPVSRYNSGRYDIAAAAATASPEQHRSAAEETRRQLESRRTYERELASSGVTVRPGSPEAALASERKPDEKSADLGNKALEQILYLQSLLGRNGRR